MSKNFKPTGSTKIRVRSNCFAWNNYSEQNINDFKSFVQQYCDYGVFGKEIAPTTNTPHLQCYFHLKDEKQMTQSKIQKLLNYNIHFSGVTKNEVRAADYCKEDGDFWEFGTAPKQGERKDISKPINKIMNGEITSDDILLNDFVLYTKYTKAFLRAETLRHRTQFRNFMTEGIWYHGGTGVGKSHIAYKDFCPTTHYVWKLNDKGWQDDYTQQKIVIIDDFRGEIPYNELLKLIDRWPYTVPRRNIGPIPFCSEVVIITSSLTPEQVYHRRHDEDSIAQLLRRVRVVNLHSEVEEGNTNASSTEHISDEFY